MTPTHQQRLAVQLARTLAGPTGQPSAAHIRDVAARAQVHPRTVRRWLQAKVPTLVCQHLATDPCPACDQPSERHPGRSRWQPDDHQLAVIAGSPNLAAAHRDLASIDAGIPSYPTFRRAIAALDSGVAAAVTRRGGAAALLSNRMYLTVTTAHRNSRWSMDSQEIPVWVHGPRGTQPRKYWQTTALDDATRMVMATVITADRPTSEDVSACIASGIRGQVLDGGTVIGGVPDQIVWDNAREFLADQVTEMALRLAFTGTAVTPFAPYEKGKIESWHRPVQNELYAMLPGASHGPRTVSQQQLWVGDVRNLLTEELLAAHARMWVEHYNTTRVHTSLAGATPLQAWTADPHPLRFVADEALWDAMMRAEQTRKVTKNGIRFRNIDYIAAGLNGLIGRRVNIRYLPHTDDSIEVFDGDEHVATAIAADKLTGAQRSELLHARHEQYQQARALMREGARLRVERYDDALAAGAGLLGPLAAVAPVGARGEDVAALAQLLDDEPQAEQLRRAQARRNDEDTEAASEQERNAVADLSALYDEPHTPLASSPHGEGDGDADGQDFQ